MKNQSVKHRASGKKRIPLILTVILLALGISALVLMRFVGLGNAEGSESFKTLVDQTELMQCAKSVKQDVKDILEFAKENDIAALEYSDRKLNEDVSALEEYISTPAFDFAAKIPFVGREVRTAKELIEISRTVSSELLKPWISLQKQTPFTDLKTEEGVDYELLRVYVAFLGEKLPTAKDVVERMDRLNLHLVDDDGKITSYVKAAKPLIAIAETYYDDLIVPGADLLSEHHPSDLKTEEGFDLEAAGEYLAFAEEKLPQGKQLLADLEAADLSLIDKNGKIDKYLQAAGPLADFLEKYLEDVIKPGYELLSTYPLSELKTEEEGIDFEGVGRYSEFLTEKQTRMEEMLKDAEKLDLSLIDKEGKLARYLKLAEQLLEVGGPANKELLAPGLKLLEDHPFSEMKADGGFRVSVILAYLDFLEEKMPAIEKLFDDVQTLDLEKLDPAGKLSKYMDKLAGLRDKYYDYKEYIPAVRVVLAGGEDRLYVFPAQNAAEVRASGGFPGNVGTIEIKDGILRVGEFNSGYAVLAYTTPKRAKITDQEVRLFTERMYAPRDVDFCIDYERVAEIWAMSYEDQMGRKVDGVISATPVVVQKLLSVCDEPITLSDGTVIDGVNATKFLQRDIYFKYKRAGMNVYAEPDMTDILFAETVKLTMEQVTSNLSASTILDYFKVLQECTEERIILIWMADEEEQEVMRQVGWSGSLNSDPNDPKLGIFFSSEQSSKMGYFFDMIPQVGEPVVNSDGSRTYDVTLTLSNVITREEVRIGGTWILGRNYIGWIVGDLTVTAPAGGSISDIHTSIPRGMRQETYHGLDTRYIQWLMIDRGQSIVIRFKVTTAPGVETPLGIMATPTLTAYRA